MPQRDVGVLIPAAGSGRRMGGARKPMLELAGRPVLAWALDAFLAHPAVQEIIVAAPPDISAEPPEWLSALPRVRVVRGGATRTESVGEALSALSDDVRRVVVHDGARPIVRRSWIDECLEACNNGDGAVVGFPAADTIKEVDASGTVTGTPDRTRLWQVQTPQAFPRVLLEQGYAALTPDAAPTDDASVVEAIGGTVRVVRGDARNIKLTRQEDVRLLEAVVSDPDWRA